VTCEEEVVTGLNLPCESHEHGTGLQYSASKTRRKDTDEYPAKVGDMTPEMYSSSLVIMSVIAAMGRPQFATYSISSSQYLTRL
jgi:hypothetical protein